jgi:hypothetical protein
LQPSPKSSIVLIIIIVIVVVNHHRRRRRQSSTSLKPSSSLQARMEGTHKLQKSFSTKKMKNTTQVFSHYFLLSHFRK